MKYTPLPVPCDLTEAVLNHAISLPHPPFYLHVHPSKLVIAQEILARPTRLRWYNEMIAVADNTLAPHEWYIAHGYGSAPPE